MGAIYAPWMSARSVAGDQGNSLGGVGIVRDLGPRRISPQTLEIVELPFVGQEDVNHEIDIVEQNPLHVIGALDVPWALADLLLYFLPHRPYDCLDLEVGVTRRNDENVRHPADVVYVKDDRIVSFLLEDAVDGQPGEPSN